MNPRGGSKMRAASWFARASVGLFIVISLASTGSAAGVTLKYWSMWNKGEPQAKVLADIVDAYEKVNPNVSVEITFAGREIPAKLRSALAAGEKVDIIDQEAISAGFVVENDLALPLDRELKTEASGETKAWEQVFFPGILDLHKTRDGKRYLVPYELITQTLFWYDKRTFEKFGVKTPKTWDEFIAVLESIKKGGVPPLTHDPQLDFLNAVWFYNLVERFLGPGALLKAAQDRTGNAWDDPAFLKAMQLEQALWEKDFYVPGIRGYTWPQGQAELAQGRAAMELIGSWMPNEVRDQVEPGFRWGAFLFPSVPGGQGDRRDVEAYVIGWVVMNKSPNVPRAIEFLKFASNRRNELRFASDALNMAARPDVPAPPALADMAQAFKDARKVFLPYDGVNVALPDYYKNVLLKNHNDGFFQRITPQEFVKRMKEDTIKYWQTRK